MGRRVNVGMKRRRMEQLRDELDKALQDDGDVVEVELYGDTINGAVNLLIGNDDMEDVQRGAESAVPDDTIFVEIED